MNWDAAGALGEIVGALAVVISLAYLAIQVRQNTAAIAAQAAHEALAAVRELNQHLMVNPPMARVWRIGQENPSDLAEGELDQFAHIVFTFFKTAEAVHAQFLKGTLDPDTWQAWERVFVTWAKSPGFAAYWSLRKGLFTPAFRGLYESWAESPEMFTGGVLAELSGRRAAPGQAGEGPMTNPHSA